MRDISASLKAVYKAHSVAIVPGGGTYAMESVARQLSPTDGPAALVLRPSLLDPALTPSSEPSRPPRLSCFLTPRCVQRQLDYFSLNAVGTTHAFLAEFLRPPPNDDAENSRQLPACLLGARRGGSKSSQVAALGRGLPRRRRSTHGQQ